MNLLRKTIYTALVLTLLLTFTACGQKGEAVHSSAGDTQQTPQNVPEPKLTATETFERAVELTADAESYDSAIEMQAVLRMGIGPFKTEQDVSATTNITYFKEPYMAKVRVSDTFTGNESEMYIAQNEEEFTVYTQNSSEEWTEQNYDSAPLHSSSGEFELLQIYAENIENAQFDEENTDADEQMTVITGEISGETIEQSVNDVLEMANFSINGYEDIFDGLQNITFHAYIDTETGLLTRLELDMGAAMAKAIQNLMEAEPDIAGGVEIEIEDYLSIIEFENYNSAQEFELPNL